MSPSHKKPLILITTTLFVLSGCGSHPVKAEPSKASSAPETAPVVVEVVAPPKLKPTAQVMAIGAQQTSFSVERLQPEKKVSGAITIERIEFNPSSAMMLAQATTEPADAPVGMGKPSANAEELKALVSGKSINRKPNIAPANKVDVEKKLRFARMMLMTKSGRRISEGDNDEAKLILRDVGNKLDIAERLLKRNDHLKADSALGEAMRLFNLAGRMVPSESLKEKWEKEYPGLQEEIEIAKDLHKRNYDKVTAKQGMGAGVNYDHQSVARLEAEAEEQADNDDYMNANESLMVARDMIQAAIRQMMTGRKIVYELNIDTPEAEYKYELNKYIGYEELIPIAIEQTKPSKGIKMLAMRHVHEAKRMADIARKTAFDTDYPRAISMLRDATVEIRKALKLMGVPNIG